jgi:hypothetical protein
MEPWKSHGLKFHLEQVITSAWRRFLSVTKIYSDTPTTKFGLKTILIFEHEFLEIADRCRYDFDSPGLSLIIRKPTCVHEMILARLEHNILQQLWRLSDGGDSNAKLVKGMKCYRSSKIILRDCMERQARCTIWSCICWVSWRDHWDLAQPIREELGISWGLIRCAKRWKRANSGPW